MKRAIVCAVLSLAACASSPKRRALLTDPVGLGTPRLAVSAWYEGHGWCGRDNVFRPCTGPTERTTPAEVRFGYAADGRMVLAEARYATVKGDPTDDLRQLDAAVPGGVDQASSPYGDSDDGRHGLALGGDRATYLLDELTRELEVRFGAPQLRTERGRRWRLPDQQIELFIGASRHVVVERYRSAPPGSAAPTPTAE